MYRLHPVRREEERGQLRGRGAADREHSIADAIGERLLTLQAAAEDAHGFDRRDAARRARRNASR